MTTIANLTFIDPRPTWDARAGEIEQAEARLAQYVSIAKKLHDVAAIGVAETRLADLRSARDVYRQQRGAVDEAFGRLDSARAQLDNASVAWSAGTDDPATALKLHAAKVVAEAAVAFTRAPLPGLCASAGASRERASPIFFSASAGETKASHSSGLAANPPTWFRTPATIYGVLGGSSEQVASANTAVPVPSAGKFQGLVGSVATSAAGATTPVYIMLFDAPLTGSAPGAGALPLWTTDPIVPGQGTSSIDATGQTNWNYGLWVGLSSTPGALTPVAGTFACDVAGG